MARDPSRLFSLLAVVCLLSPIHARSQSKGTLEITVTDNRGFPDPNATLTLVSEDRVREDKVDKSGHSEFTNLPPKGYELRVWSPSFADVIVPNIQITSEVPMVVNISQKLFTPPTTRAEPECSSFDIKPLPSLGSLVAYEERVGKVNFTGSIAEEFNGKPLSGARITLSKVGRNEKNLSIANSDENGIFEFVDLDPGRYTFAVSRDGYYPAREGFQFWVTRENLTRIGTILLSGNTLQDICGMGAIETPAINPKSIPAPELIPPKPGREKR